MRLHQAGRRLVAAAGRPAMITPEMVKPGAAIVDVATTAPATGSSATSSRFAEVAGALPPSPAGSAP